jgi:hypothetical protein
MLKNRLFRNGALVAIAGIAAFGATALFANKAEAKCYLIYCPAPAPQPQVRTEVVEERVVYVEDRVQKTKKVKKAKVVRAAPKKAVSKSCATCYKAGYKAGYRDGRASVGAKKVTYKAPAKPVKKVSYAQTNQGSGRVVTKTVTRVVRTYNDTPANNVYANNNYRQSSNGVVNYAAAYNAPAYSQSIPVAAYAGRGEQWVATRTQVIRYGAPAQVSYANGQACGYGAPISNPYGQKAWVCKCAQGWMPPR